MHVHPCLVAGNTVWSHMAGDALWLSDGFPHHNTTADTATVPHTILSVHPSVCPSHVWISQKWCRLGSPKSSLLGQLYNKSKVRFFHNQSNQIWSPIYWSLINLMFRIDCWSTAFRFNRHFRSPTTWSAISWSAINWAYFMPIWLADSDLNLRCCANEHALRVDAIGSKRRHSNDINDIVHIVCCQKYVVSQINVGASIHFISSQNTMHSINWSVVTDHNFILMHELPFWPATRVCNPG